jgi:uncharacterized membrane protein YgdD (TMEM256/DUF423 family)
MGLIRLSSIFVKYNHAPIAKTIENVILIILNSCLFINVVKINLPKQLVALNLLTSLIFLTMIHTHRKFVKIGFLSMALAVGLGAFGAHGLSDLIDEKYLEVWETAVRYLIIHATALILLGLMHRKFDEKILNYALNLFILGIMLFSGSLLLLASSEVWAGEKLTFFGAIAPLGGISFIAGWFILFLKGFGVDKDNGGIITSDKKHSSSHSHRKRRLTSRESKSEPASQNDVLVTE